MLLFHLNPFQDKHMTCVMLLNYCKTNKQFTTFFNEETKQKNQTLSWFLRVNFDLQYCNYVDFEKSFHQLSSYIDLNEKNRGLRVLSS